MEMWWNGPASNSDLMSCHCWAIKFPLIHHQRDSSVTRDDKLNELPRAGREKMNQRTSRTYQRRIWLCWLERDVQAHHRWPKRSDRDLRLWPVRDTLRRMRWSFWICNGGRVWLWRFPGVCWSWSRCWDLWTVLCRWSTSIRDLGRCWRRDDRGTFRRHPHATNHWSTWCGWSNRSRTNGSLDLWMVAGERQCYHRDHLISVAQYVHARNVCLHYRSIDICDWRRALGFIPSWQGHWMLSPECVALLDRTLCDEWYAIVVLGVPLPDTVPMEGHFHTLHVILNIDNNLIILAHLYTGAGNHTIDCQDTALNAIS